MPAPQPVACDGDLRKLCDELAAADQLYLDTEFERTRTYLPRLCLVQVKTGDLSQCVDALAGIDLSPLWEILWAPHTLKLFHAARQDLELLTGIQGAPPAPLMDTQIAAALAGFDSQIGYAALVRELLGLELEKESTRTDWTRRPLSDQQIEYAINDVAWLPDLHDRLSKRLHDLDRYAWAEEDSARLTDPKLYQVDPDAAWQKVRGIGSLEDDPWWRAKALAAWREKTARRVDRPRGWVLADRVLLSIAASRPRGRDELARIPEMPRGVVRNRGDELLRILARADDSRPAKVPRPERRGRPSAEEQAGTKYLLNLARKRAGKLGIPSEVLTTRKECAAMVSGERNLRVLEGWRREIVGLQLLDALDAAA